MTVVPLPDSPCLRIRLDWTDSDGALAGSRFNLSYAGAAPSGANCVSIATAVEAAWTANLVRDTPESYALTRVDCLDITTADGSSGEWNGSSAGTDSGQVLPSNCAANIEFLIARRYRGGKPRIFLPSPSADGLLNQRQFTAAFTAQLATDWAAFIGAVEAIDVGAVGALSHVNLSYYAGFTNHTNTSGRERAVPTYRSSALVEPITGYAVKAVVASQRRRRTATTY